jgi:BMFP domain-containing protein YqiC
MSTPSARAILARTTYFYDTAHQETRTMIQPGTPAKVLEELGNKFTELMQSGPARDFEKNTKALFASAFARLDLVTREEFEVQKALLASTREKLDALERKIAELESGSTPASPAK